MGNNVFIRISNLLTAVRRPKVKPEQLLLLVPHCLQVNTCKNNVRSDVDACQRCGQCQIDDILDLRDRYGIRVELVSGGRKAVAAARSPDVRAIVAVACNKELIAGLKAVFPKATLAVANRQPEGPCVNTTVDINAVEDAIRKLLGRQPG